MIFTKQEWFTPAEVAIHNRASDCWVSLNGKVRNLTSWLQDQFRLCKCTKICSCAVKNWYCGDDCVEYCSCFKRGYPYCDAKRLAMTVLAYAGKDVSHWFKGDDWVHYTHPIVASRTEYHQHGHGLKRPVVPSTLWRPITNPWWLDDKNVEGKLTERTRPIRITNSLTGSSVTLEVCSEETIYQIMMRYLPHNSHMLSYTWRYLGRRVDYNKTLADNGIPDERDRFSDVALPENLHIPNLLLYYNDDLTEGLRSWNIPICSEEIIYRIMMSYLPHNSHMLSYTWRYLGRRVDYNKTLADNGIPDERDRFSDVALPENLHIPNLLLYYNDDLTEDPPKDDCFCHDIDCVLDRPEKCYKDVEF